MHMHAEDTTLADDDVESEGHDVHVASPGASLYLPATHVSHTPPSGPVYPGLHTQSPTSSLDPADWESAGQPTH